MQRVARGMLASVSAARDMVDCVVCDAILKLGGQDLTLCLEVSRLAGREGSCCGRVVSTMGAKSQSCQ